MYRTCLFCHDDLGGNEGIEALPIGRRLAFDTERGRLWVVCRKCGRWNLTPFEERWEALEQCERAFRGTRRRVSTDNIGLARVADGVELVRIGRALRSELAAWRYGDQFGARRRRHLLTFGAGMVAVSAVMLGGPAAGLVTGGAVQLLNWGLQGATQYRLRRTVAVRVPVEASGGKRLLELAQIHVHRSRLVDDGAGGWALDLAHRGTGERLAYGMETGLRHVTPSTLLTGDAARRAAALLLPRLNDQGGSARQVNDAVRLVEHDGTGDAMFRATLAALGKAPAPRATFGAPRRDGADPHRLGSLPRAIRLALEMAAHEESERRALEGELAELEAAWREAEEIAAIADDLLLPDGAAARLEALRATRDRTPT